jgi:hypothetical protein
MIIRSILNIILVSILIIFIQIFFLYDVNVFGLITPMVYLYLIIILPFNTPIVLMILYSFIVGFVIDGFYNTGGMHTIPTLLIGLIRPVILSMIVPQKGFDLGGSISIYTWNIFRAAIFIFSLTFIHHFILFSIEAVNLSGVFIIFFRTLLSTLVSMMFMFIFLLFKK